MKKLLLVLSGIIFFASLSIGGESGESIFKSLGCMSCHRPEKSSKINPSIVEIAQAYQGKTDQLVYYLNGQAEAVVKPEKAAMMKRHVEKTKALTDQERVSLAEFILRHKQ